MFSTSCKVIVCSSSFKKGEPKFLNEKKFWGGGNQKGGNIFKKKGGNPTFLS